MSNEAKIEEPPKRLTFAEHKELTASDCDQCALLCCVRENEMNPPNREPEIRDGFWIAALISGVLIFVLSVISLALRFIDVLGVLVGYWFVKTAWAQLKKK